MRRTKRFFLVTTVFLFALSTSSLLAMDTKLLIGTWSYEKTESNLTGRGITLKVFSEWLITFNANGTYTERSKVDEKQKPDVNGTYKVEGDLIIRSKNQLGMKILVLTNKALVITSFKNTKIFFTKKI